jgi:diguanylate cyclase (GGDEF)-like protein
MAVTAKVMVCDDDSINLEVVRELLQDDYEVACVEGGEACLVMLPDFQPDILMLDLMMPGIDGYETCRRIVAASPESVPQIILVSARTSSAERVRGYEVGADDYICKPFDHDELRAKVAVQARLRRALVGLTDAKAKIEMHATDLERLVHERTAELLVAKEQSEELARKLAESNCELAVLARVDSLTRLLNRAAWDEIAQREQDRSRRYHHPFSIVIIDVDYFKFYNDSQGHGAGDDCLRSVAGEIAHQCRLAEYVGRYGGEEFVVLAPNTDLEGGLVLAERIRGAIERLNISHPASPTCDRVTVSVGVACRTAGSWASCLKAADAALYSAKRDGRNQVCAAPMPAEAASSGG